jgi:hypothetical protein
MVFTTFPPPFHNFFTVYWDTGENRERSDMLNNTIWRQMMYRRGIFFRIVLAIILVLLIIAGGAAAYRMGWGQGYVAASALESGEGLESGLMSPPFRGHLYSPYYFGFGFPFLGLCFGIGFIFLIMFLLGGILKPWRRRRWAHHGKWGPPWVKDWEEYQKYKAEKEATTEEQAGADE